MELVVFCSLSRDDMGADCALVAVVCYPVADMEFINHVKNIPDSYPFVKYYLNKNA